MVTGKNLATMLKTILPSLPRAVELTEDCGLCPSSSCFFSGRCRCSVAVISSKNVARLLSTSQFSRKPATRCQWPGDHKSVCHTSPHYTTCTRCAVNRGLYSSRVSAGTHVQPCRPVGGIIIYPPAGRAVSW